MIATFTLLSPLHHGAFSDADTGNLAPLRRVPLARDGVVTDIPCVSGNAIRGCARRLLARHLLDTTGVGPAVAGPEPYQRLYAALANGGHLDGSEATVRPAERQALRDAIPALSVLGAALYTYMLPGRVEVGTGWLVCGETVAAGLVSPRPWPPLLGEDLVREWSHVRHVDRDQHDPAVSGVTPMPTVMETICAGSELECRVVDHRATGLERSALAFALSSIGHLGGKGGAGLGTVSTVVQGASGDEYVAWLAAHVDESREALVALASSVARRGKARA